MIGVDYAILIIVGISALLSLRRGFMQEALSLAGWLCAYWVTISYSQGMVELLGNKISTPVLRTAVAFILLFVLSLVAVAGANMVFGMLVRATGFSGTDKMLGVLFGILRGCLIITALVMLVGFTSMPAEAWWKESMFLKYFQQAAMWLRAFLPAEFAKFMHY